MNLEDLRKTYEKDRFATHAGCQIIEADKDKVICEMPLCDDLRNAHGGIMGGAIFTLADFAFAVASNLEGVPSVVIECNIRYYAATKGEKLIAICTTDREGHTLGHYTVEIKDDLDKKIAGYTAIAYHHRTPVLPKKVAESSC
ncbi:MAG: PaaI family thioesterase [Ruminococcaceae bacterium]|nr:PaaI family thioesterase [Oscillospiraceae bacterium]